MPYFYVKKQARLYNFSPISAFNVNFRRAPRHPRPFRPSHLIHASSQNHFTEPTEPHFDEEDDEEFYRPESEITIGKYHVNKPNQIQDYHHQQKHPDQHKMFKLHRNDAIRHTKYEFCLVTISY